MDICPSCGAVLKDLEEMELIEELEAKLPPEVNKHPKQVKVENYPILNVPSLDTKVKKKNHKFLVYLGVFGLVILFILSAINFKKTYTKSTIKEEVDNKIKFSSYLFDIPNNFHVYNSLDGLTITNSNEEIAYTIQLISNTFLFCLNDQDTLKSEYEKQGFKVDNVKESKVVNQDYLTMELSKDDNNILVAYRSAPRSDSFVVMITFKDNQINYQELDNLENILKKVKMDNVK